MASHQSRSVLSVLLLLMLIHLCQAAPGPPGTHREEESLTTQANPFLPGDDDRRLLQSYIDSILNKDDQGGAEIITWEQEVFFLFRLYDFDRSGFLDGLEMIKLLSDYNAHHKPGVIQSYNEVVSMVDFLLQTQDLNHDGLFSPSELLSPPLLQKEHSEAAEDHKEMVQEKIQTETMPQEEMQPVEDVIVVAVEEQHAQQALEVHIPGEKETIAASVHQGQPEM